MTENYLTPNVNNDETDKTLIKMRERKRLEE